MIFNAHDDIWTNVALKRCKGFNNIIKNFHLKKFREGDIGGGIFVIWPDTNYDNNPQKRIIEILLNLSTEVIDNMDILSIVRNYDDLINSIETGKLAIIIGIEGLNFINDDIKIIDALYMFGVRHVSLTWNEENNLATGINGNPCRGLTQKGVDIIKRLEKLGVIIDVSHANEKTFWDIYETTEKPFIASHSNCRSLCDVKRNLNDQQLRAVSEIGGVVGLNAFGDFVSSEPNKRDLKHLVNHLDHMVNIMGIDHVGFGFDIYDYLTDETIEKFTDNSFDGILNFENITKTSNIINELKLRGYTAEDIEKIKYKNFYRVFKSIL